MNPLFFEGIEANYEGNDIEELPPIIVDIFDKDDGILGDSYDFLARSVITLQEEEHKGVTSFGHNDETPKPVWYPLYYKKGGPKSGEVLLSFALAESDDYTYKKDIKALNLHSQITMKEFQVNMNILGLRGL